MGLPAGRAREGWPPAWVLFVTQAARCKHKTPGKERKSTLSVRFDRRLQRHDRTEEPAQARQARQAKPAGDAKQRGNARRVMASVASATQRVTSRRRGQPFAAPLLAWLAFARSLGFR